VWDVISGAYLHWLQGPLSTLAAIGQLFVTKNGYWKRFLIYCLFIGMSMVGFEIFEKAPSKGFLYGPVCILCIMLGYCLRLQRVCKLYENFQFGLWLMLIIFLFAISRIVASILSGIYGMVVCFVAAVGMASMLIFYITKKWTNKETTSSGGNDNE
jgi:hypothetical protein